MRKLAILVTIVSLIAAATGAIAHNGVAHSRNGSSTVDPNAPAVQIGGPFTLVNGDGKTVTEKDFIGKYQIIFFGFTFCPDICPTELQNIQAALDIAGKDIADKTQVILISIDPERDTPAKMREYTRQFGDNIAGLTGTPEQIEAVARAFKIYYARSAETADDEENYLMDHSSFVYFMNRDGKYLSVFRAGTDPKEMADTLTADIKAGR